jgi:hypothetical protein
VVRISPSYERPNVIGFIAERAGKDPRRSFTRLYTPLKTVEERGFPGVVPLNGQKISHEWRDSPSLDHRRAQIRQSRDSLASTSVERATALVNPMW